MKICFPDGTQREVIRIYPASKIVEKNGFNPKTFLKYIDRSKIASIKIGYARYVELSIATEWSGSLSDKAEPVFIGY